MNKVKNLATVLLVLVSVVTTSYPANACVCAMKSDLKTVDAINQWLYDKAKIVVKGKVTGVSPDITKLVDGSEYISAGFAVSSVLKGNISPGIVTIRTSTKRHLCGIAGIIKGAFEKKVELTIEINETKKFRGKPSYVAGLCGLLKFDLQK